MSGTRIVGLAAVAFGMLAQDLAPSVREILVRAGLELLTGRRR